MNTKQRRGKEENGLHYVVKGWGWTGGRENRGRKERKNSGRKNKIEREKRMNFGVRKVSNKFEQGLWLDREGEGERRFKRKRGIDLSVTGRKGRDFSPSFSMEESWLLVRSPLQLSFLLPFSFLLPSPALLHSSYLSHSVTFPLPCSTVILHLWSISSTVHHCSL